VKGGLSFIFITIIILNLYILFLISQVLDAHFCMNTSRFHFIELLFGFHLLSLVIDVFQLFPGVQLVDQHKLLFLSIILKELKHVFFLVYLVNTLLSIQVLFEFMYFYGHFTLFVLQIHMFKMFPILIIILNLANIRSCSSIRFVLPNVSSMILFHGVLDVFLVEDLIPQTFLFSSISHA